MTPAEELSAAITVLRGAVHDASDGPWAADDPNRRWGDDCDHRLVGGGKILATFSNDHNGPLNAMFAALMHPGVGEAIAKWLGTWVGIDLREDAALPEDAQHALAIARLINKAAT
ncbi:hypothetical protein ACFWPQ_01625 [Streptomyces sp. NPDC058464]|uniref:hypothetical protein n=1 Tax=Streptomyces sp. NPDC058464 TaxID=3346511 RepID=UPI00365EE436